MTLVNYAGDSWTLLEGELKDSLLQGELTLTRDVSEDEDLKILDNPPRKIKIKGVFDHGRCLKGVMVIDYVNGRVGTLSGVLHSTGEKHLFGSLLDGVKYQGEWQEKTSAGKLLFRMRTSESGYFGAPTCNLEENGELEFLSGDDEQNNQEIKQRLVGCFKNSILTHGTALMFDHKANQLIRRVGAFKFIKWEEQLHSIDGREPQEERYFYRGLTQDNLDSFEKGRFVSGLLVEGLSYWRVPMGEAQFEDYYYSGKFLSSHSTVVQKPKHLHGCNSIELKTF